MKYVYYGEYYTTSTYGLIKVAAKGLNPATNKTMVVFTPVKTGGMVGEPLVMNEDDLIALIEKA